MSITFPHQLFTDFLGFFFPLCFLGSPVSVCYLVSVFSVFSLSQHEHNALWYIYCFVSDQWVYTTFNDALWDTVSPLSMVYIQNWGIVKEFSHSLLTFVCLCVCVCCGCGALVSLLTSWLLISLHTCNPCTHQLSGTSTTTPHLHSCFSQCVVAPVLWTWGFGSYVVWITELILVSLCTGSLHVPACFPGSCFPPVCWSVIQPQSQPSAFICFNPHHHVKAHMKPFPCLCLVGCLYWW